MEGSDDSIAIQDRLELTWDRSETSTDVYGTSCLKPFCPPDRWDDADNDSLYDPAEPYDDLNGNGAYDPGEPFTDTNGNSIWDPAEFYDPEITGYRAPDDIGIQMILRLISSAKSPRMGWYYAVRFPPYTGSSAYMDWIVGCLDSSVIVSVGDQLQLEPGNMVGPTAQGLNDLISQDPTAQWDQATNSVINSAYPVSPRIIKIVAFDPTLGVQSLPPSYVTVSKIMVLFVEQHNGADMVLRFMGAVVSYRGDVNGDGLIDVGDVVYLVDYLYKDGPAPNPEEIGDVNCDGVVNVGDVIHLVNYLYRGGPPPCEP